MQDDPVQYWQDLTANYAQMSDGELLDLAWKPEDLTEVAGQVVRYVMKQRGLAARPTESPSRASTPCAWIGPRRCTGSRPDFAMPRAKITKNRSCLMSTHGRRTCANATPGRRPWMSQWC